jgi:hypothetical protein
VYKYFFFKLCSTNVGLFLYSEAVQTKVSLHSTVSTREAGTDNLWTNIRAMRDTKVDTCGLTNTDVRRQSKRITGATPTGLLVNPNLPAVGSFLRANPSRPFLFTASV